MSDIKSVLFVCTGNTCRSPMAAALLQTKLRERGLTDVKVWSRGLFAGENAPMTWEAQEALHQKNIEFEHKTHQLTEEDVAYADVILTMEAFQKEHIIEKFPSAANKTFLVSEFAGMGPIEIKDPALGGATLTQFLDDTTTKKSPWSGEAKEWVKQVQEQKRKKQKRWYLHPQEQVEPTEEEVKELPQDESMEDILQNYPGAEEADEGSEAESPFSLPPSPYTLPEEPSAAERQQHWWEYDEPNKGYELRPMTEEEKKRQDELRKKQQEEDQKAYNKTRDELEVAIDKIVDRIAK